MWITRFPTAVHTNSSDGHRSVSTPPLHPVDDESAANGSSKPRAAAKRSQPGPTVAFTVVFDVADFGQPALQAPLQLAEPALEDQPGLAG